MKTIVVSCAMLAAAGGLALVALSGRARHGAAPGASVQEEPSNRAEVDRLATVVGELQGELRLLQSQQRDLRASPANASAPVAAPPSATSRHDEYRAPAVVSPAEEQAEAFRYVQYADGVLKSEAKDNRWNDARELAPRIRTVLPAGSQVQSVDCGTTLCRVETRHQNMEAHRAFVRGMTFQPKPGDMGIKTFWPGPTLFLVLSDPQNPSEEVRAVAYLARADSQLPSPP